MSQSLVTQLQHVPIEWFRIVVLISEFNYINSVSFSDQMSIVTNQRTKHPCYKTAQTLEGKILKVWNK